MWIRHVLVGCYIRWIPKAPMLILITALFAELIIVLKEGQVIEQGWHEDLVRLKGHYYT